MNKIKILFLISLICLIAFLGVDFSEAKNYWSEDLEKCPIDAEGKSCQEKGAICSYGICLIQTCQVDLQGNLTWSKPTCACGCPDICRWENEGFWIEGEECGGGLVPCGRHCDDPCTQICEACPCTICHFFLLLKRIVDKIIMKWIIPPLAVIVFVGGGLVLMTSRGDPKGTSLGKDILISGTIGIVVILGAVIIVDTIIAVVTGANSPYQEWHTIDCPIIPHECFDEDGDNKLVRGTCYDPDACLKGCTDTCLDENGNPAKEGQGPYIREYKCDLEENLCVVVEDINCPGEALKCKEGEAPKCKEGVCVCVVE